MSSRVAAHGIEVGGAFAAQLSVEIPDGSAAGFLVFRILAGRHESFALFGRHASFGDVRRDLAPRFLALLGLARTPDRAHHHIDDPAGATEHDRNDRYEHLRIISECVNRHHVASLRFSIVSNRSAHSAALARLHQSLALLGAHGSLGDERRDLPARAFPCHSGDRHCGVLGDAADHDSTDDQKPREIAVVHHADPESRKIAVGQECEHGANPNPSCRFLATNFLGIGGQGFHEDFVSISPSGRRQTPSPEAQDAAVVADVLGAYSKGWFPMAQPDRRTEAGETEIEWVQPHRRAILPLDQRFHIPRSLVQRVRSGRFRVTTDRAFEAVIRGCASVPRTSPDGEGANSAWLAPDIIDAFLLLHKHGHAHSVEAWIESPGAKAKLVGGLYGLALGKIFCGESMFHRADLGGTDASKVCLVHLVCHLRARGFELLDAQLANPHTAQFGMFEMPRTEYLARLSALAPQKVEWAPFEPARL
ncbi:MAG: leucyl/phenylalanyl-tRNA--protein transferase [Phycisphaeraceae bacterium]|nr:leucyl/phenylalanyl-tRNA--protein transferase [Phycisphaeraceae bacterium]